MIASFVPSPSWSMPSKQRLGTLLAQAPAHTRVAPSPTGHVHVGTLRTALHNVLCARVSGGRFVLRIDDTDQARNNDSHVCMIHDSLRHLGLMPDHVFSQSSRHAHHVQVAHYLLRAKWAMHDNGAIRLAPQAQGLVPSQFFDLAAGICNISSTLLSQADGLVLLRRDGQPTYHFASVLDDIDTNITLIVRGVDHLSNVAKHIAVAQALAMANYPNAQAFCQTVTLAHVGLIMKQGKKLSKRDPDSSASNLLTNQVPPPALLQWLLPLGWGHPDPALNRHHPLMGWDQMCSLFAQGGLRSSNCNLDTAKLAWLCKQWSALSPPSGMSTPSRVIDQSNFQTDPHKND